MVTKLSEWMRVTDQTGQAVAEACGTSAATISRIKAGIQQPQVALALRLSHLTGMPVDAFDRIEAEPPSTDAAAEVE